MFAFLYRSFSFVHVRHRCVFVFRSRFSTVFRQFSPTLSLSFLSILRQFFNFFVFLNRSFSYLRHCCIFVFRCRSFTFLRHCCLIVFRSSTVFRQFSPTLFTFLCRSFSFLNRSFSFLSHCYVFDFRCRFPIVFRQFSPTSFAFAVVLCLSRARC